MDSGTSDPERGTADADRGASDASRGASEANRGASNADRGAPDAGRFDRERSEAALSALVRGNRFTIAVVFPLVGAVLFVAGHEGLLPAWLAMNPVLVLFGTLVMRLPLVAGLAPLTDRRAAAGLLAVTAYSYAVEYVGVATGVPYGEFHYRAELGPMVAGVPVGLPVFFVPLVLNGYLLVLLLFPRLSRLRRVVASLGVVLVVDLVLDPAAVALGLWAYAGGGPYYGVPLSNYAGWALSGLVAVTAVEYAFDRRKLVARLDDCEFALDDFVSFVLLWGAINAYFGNWVAVALAGALAAGLRKTDRFDFAVLRGETPG